MGWSRGVRYAHGEADMCKRSSSSTTRRAVASDPTPSSISPGAVAGTSQESRRLAALRRKREGHPEALGDISVRRLDIDAGRRHDDCQTRPSAPVHQRDSRRRHTGRPRKRVLDFAQLDPVAVYLDLIVDAADDGDLFADRTYSITGSITAFAVGGHMKRPLRRTIVLEVSSTTVSPAMTSSSGKASPPTINVVRPRRASLLAELASSQFNRAGVACKMSQSKRARNSAPHLGWLCHSLRPKPPASHR